MLLENGQLKACTYDPIKDETTLRLVLPGKQADDNEARQLAQQTDLEVSINSAQLRIPFSTRDGVRAAVESAVGGNGGHQEELPFTDELEEDEDLEDHAEASTETPGARRRRTLDPARKVTNTTLKKLYSLHYALIKHCHKSEHDLLGEVQQGYNVTRYEDLTEAQAQQVCLHFNQVREAFEKADAASELAGAGRGA